MRLIDEEKLPRRHFYTKGGHSIMGVSNGDIQFAETFDLEAFEAEIREDERKKQQDGPIKWSNVWYSTEFEEIVDKHNKLMTGFDGKENRIRLSKDLGTDGKFHGECTIEADNAEEMFLLLDALICHVLEESGEFYAF